MSWKNLALPSSYQSLLSSAPDVQTPSTREEVIDLIFGKGIDTATCSYDIPVLLLTTMIHSCVVVIPIAW